MCRLMFRRMSGSQGSSDGFITYISPVIKQITGFSSETITGRSIKEFIHIDEYTFASEQFSDALTKVIPPIEFRVKSLINKYHWVRVSALPLNENGVSVGIQGIITDINKNKLAEFG